MQPLHVLINAGSSDSITLKSHCKTAKNWHKEKTPTVWETVGGTYETLCTADIQFKLPEFSESKLIEFKFHISETNIDETLGYDMIIGRDLLSAL